MLTVPNDLVIIILLCTINFTCNSVQEMMSYYGKSREVIVAKEVMLSLFSDFSQGPGFSTILAAQEKVCEGVLCCCSVASPDFFF